MSSKMNQIPFLSSYEDVRAEMNRDFRSGLVHAKARFDAVRLARYDSVGWV